jgi:hypothetical protein
MTACPKQAGDKETLSPQVLMPTAPRVMTDLNFTVQSTWWGVKPPPACVFPRPPTDPTDGQTALKISSGTKPGVSSE